MRRRKDAARSAVAALEAEAAETARTLARVEPGIEALEERTAATLELARRLGAIQADERAQTERFERDRVELRGELPRIREAVAGLDQRIAALAREAERAARAGDDDRARARLTERRTAQKSRLICVEYLRTLEESL